MQLGNDVLEQARAGSLSKPLAYEPFFLAAKVHEQAGRSRRALELMTEAKRRRPNRTATRLQMVVYQGRRGDHTAFLNEVDYVLRRSEKTKEGMLPELVKLVPDPAGRQALAKMLARDPPWREDFFGVAGNRGVNPADAEALVALIRRNKGDGDLRLERAFLVQSLVASKRYGDARQVWAQTVGLKSAPPLLFDGDFKGVPAAPPFNWSFQDLDVGRATLVSEKEGGPRLDVEYLGGKNAVLAEQMLALPPGSYSLRFLARSDTELKSGGIYWRLACLPDNRQLVEVEVKQLQASFSKFGKSFAVPASGCTGQRLQLVAEAGEYPNGGTLSVANMVISNGR
jgi:hypothetical protein